jgi:hypothetical protein
MEDKLRHVLSVRTLIEMTLIRASRIATTATIEELMKAVRSLKSSGTADLPEIRIQSERLSASIAPTPAPMNEEVSETIVASPTPSEPNQTASAQSSAYSKPVSHERREEILNDDKLNSILASAPGALISDIRGR